MKPFQEGTLGVATSAEELQMPWPEPPQKGISPHIRVCDTLSRGTSLHCLLNQDTSQHVSSNTATAYPQAHPGQNLSRANPNTLTANWHSPSRIIFPLRKRSHNTSTITRQTLAASPHTLAVTTLDTSVTAHRFHHRHALDTISPFSPHHNIASSKWLVGKGNQLAARRDRRRSLGRARSRIVRRLDCR